MPDVEVVNNAKVDKLRRQGVIDVETAEESGASAEPAVQPDAESAAEPVDLPTAGSADQPEEANGSPDV
jgi:hypothetical protein